MHRCPCGSSPLFQRKLRTANRFRAGVCSSSCLPSLQGRYAKCGNVSRSCHPHLRCGWCLRLGGCGCLAGAGTRSRTMRPASMTRMRSAMLRIDSLWLTSRIVMRASWPAAARRKEASRRRCPDWNSAHQAPANGETHKRRGQGQCAGVAPGQSQPARTNLGVVAIRQRGNQLMHPAFIDASRMSRHPAVATCAQYCQQSSGKQVDVLCNIANSLSACLGWPLLVIETIQSYHALCWHKGTGNDPGECGFSRTRWATRAVSLRAQGRGSHR